MTNSQEIKQKLDESADWVGNFFTDHLGPRARGTLIIILFLLLLISIYLLTRKETPRPQELSDSEKKRIEAMAEEKILKRMEFLRKLRA